MARWDCVAWLAMCQPRMTKDKLTFEDFHPLRTKRKAGEYYQLSDSRKRRARWVEEGKIAKCLSEEERERRWKNFCARTNDRRHEV